MSEQHPTNPLHKMTLEKILIALVEQYGWDKLSKSIDINCFYTNPSIKSCLKLLRKTPWARIKVEDMYVRMAKKMNKS